MYKKNTIKIIEEICEILKGEEYYYTMKIEDYGFTPSLLIYSRGGIIFSTHLEKLIRVFNDNNISWLINTAPEKIAIVLYDVKRINT